MCGKKNKWVCLTNGTRVPLRKTMPWFGKILDKLLSKKVVLRGHGLPGAKLTHTRLNFFERMINGNLEVWGKE